MAASDLPSLAMQCPTTISVGTLNFDNLSCCGFNLFQGRTRHKANLIGTVDYRKTGSNGTAHFSKSAYLLTGPRHSPCAQGWCVSQERRRVPRAASTHTDARNRVTKIWKTDEGCTIAGVRGFIDRQQTTAAIRKGI